MIGSYTYKSLSLYNRFLETVHINNNAILNFVNIWSKGVIINIIYPRNVNKIGGYMDTNIFPKSVRYIISSYKQINNRKKKRNIIKGSNIIRLLRKMT